MVIDDAQYMFASALLDTLRPDVSWIVVFRNAVRGNFALRSEST